MFRKLLEYHSAFFAAALDPQSPFSKDNSACFEIASDIDVFDVFYGWAYTGRLKDATDTDRADDVYLSYRLLCRVWVFADFRGIPELANKAIDMLREKFSATSQTPFLCVRDVYKDTVAESQLRNFSIWMTATSWTLKGLEEGKARGNSTKDFLFDVLPALAKKA